jgi:transcriptional regulator with XRE-family HTH domain
MFSYNIWCYLDEMSSQSWAEQDAARIGAEVHRLRRKRSGSAQWLSDRTAEVGHRLQRAMISELERGKRKYVTTAELVVLAAALNVAPVALLYPAPYDEDIEVTPGRTMSKIGAVERFSGHRPDPLDPRAPDDDGEYWHNLRDLTRARRIRELRQRRRNFAEQMRILGDLEAPESVRDAMRVMAEEQEQISKLLEEELESDGYGG